MDLQNRRANQERLALSMARFSPAAAYQLAAMNIAGTDSRLKPRYEDAMRHYRSTFLEYAEKKQEESGGGHGGIEINFSSDSGFKIKTSRNAGAVDVSDRPRFEPPRRSMPELVSSTLVDLGLLATFILFAFVTAFVAFLRYDVR